MQNTLKIAKTDFEKKINKKIEIKILYDKDLNFKEMKKNSIKLFKNETLYNYLISNHYFINDYYNILSIYYPLYSILYQKIL